METSEHHYAHAFLSLGNVGSETLRVLAGHFGSLEQAWLAPAGAYVDLPRIRQEKKDRLAHNRSTVEPEALWATLRESGINLFLRSDLEYPALLKEIPEAPYALYTKGSYDWTVSRPMIAIVGSRKFTPYGRQVAEQLAADLTQAGFVVVSGLAFGIDSVSHEAALEARGDTIAVLGSGINRISPTSHIPLAEKIMRHGAIVSEYPPEMNGDTWTFPARNRIIAGLTLGTIVIEAAESSGSLITAQYALEYNREVFAIPGPIFSLYSQGTNALIKHGAKLVTGIQDILEELSSRLPTTSLPVSEQVSVSLTSEESKLLSLLSREPLHIDVLIKQSTLSSATVSTLLTMLEIKGLAKNVGGMHYVRV